MKEIIRYIADDGKVFDDEDDCREYEKQTHYGKLKDGVKALDYQFRPVDAFECDVHFYVNILDASFVEDYVKYCDEYFGISVNIKSPGVWYYDEINDLFVNIDEEIEALKNKKELIMSKFESTNAER